MKKIFALALAAAMSLSLVACGGGNGGTSTPAKNDGADKSAASSATGSSTGSTDAAGDSTLPEITAGSCETPVIVTSIGQSADVDIVKTLCNKAGLENTTNATISADELTADTKTLILAVGGSSKGLGAAGIDADQELARTDALLAKAKELGITVVATHTGGSARRGTLSDSFIVPAFGAADMAIVLSEGDADGLMSGILAENSTPTAVIEQVTDCVTVLQTLFGL